MQPLIDKFAIDVEKNTVFARIIEMFDGQPNYQLWGVKAVFGRATTIEGLEEIKAWADDYPQCIKQLSKNGNIISYTSKEDLTYLLPREMQGLAKKVFVNHMVSIFNTDQRKILSDAIGLEKATSLSYSNDEHFRNWCDLLTNFSKLSGDTKKKIIGRMSSIRDAGMIRQGLIDGLAEKYKWNREDFLAFAAVNTPNAEVVHSDGDIVILEVKSYADSRKLCFGRTSWCITSSEGQWKSYVGDKTGNKQFFFFDFSKDEKDELAHIGFTINGKNGFYAAHTTSDSSLMNQGITYKGKRMTIQKALTDAKVPLGMFLQVRPNKNFTWGEEGLLKLVEKNDKNLAIAYHQNKRVILNALTQQGLKMLVDNTYIKEGEFPVTSDTKVYVMYDFNLEEKNDNSVIVIYYKKDQYKIESLERVVNSYSTSLKEDNYLAKVGIRTDDFLSREKINPSILLHKLIDEGDAEGACQLIDSKEEVDVNYEFNHRRPIFNAIDAKMHQVVGKIIANDKFDANVDNGLGESLIQDLLFTFYLDATCKLDEKDAQPVRELLETIIDSNKFDLNFIDDNDDTAINIACMNENMAWLVEKLAAMPDVNINVRNDCDCTALGNALRKKNIKAVEILGRRPDLEVTEFDHKLAKNNGIDLKKFIKPQPFAKTDEVKVEEGKAVVTETIDADKYDEIFKKVFSAKK